MYLSKTVGYAVHALSYVENAKVSHCFIQDIALATGIRKPYLAKITNQLTRRGLLTAKRGYRGGVALARSPREISLLQIVQALDDKAWSRPCFFGLENCGAARRCPAHDMWTEMRSRMETILRETTLADVAKAIKPLVRVPTPSVNSFPDFVRSE